MKGHIYDHGVGDICKKCNKIHPNPVKIFPESCRKAPREKVKINLMITKSEKGRLDKLREETQVGAM